MAFALFHFVSGRYCLCSHWHVCEKFYVWRGLLNKMYVRRQIMTLLDACRPVAVPDIIFILHLETWIWLWSVLEITRYRLHCTPGELIYTWLYVVKVRLFWSLHPREKCFQVLRCLEWTWKSSRRLQKRCVERLIRNAATLNFAFELAEKRKNDGANENLRILKFELKWCVSKEYFRITMYKSLPIKIWLLYGHHLW